MDKESAPRLLDEKMLKKIDFKSLNYSELERLDAHDLKRDEMTSFYQTFDFLDLVKKWPEISGIFKNKTSPLKLKNGTLYIIVAHPSVAHDLSYAVEELKTVIFKEFPKMRNIISKFAYQTHAEFFENKIKEAEKTGVLTQKLHPQSPRYKVLKAEAEKFFADIEDPEFRERLMSLYIQSH